MYNNEKIIKIGKLEYMVCTDDKNNQYLYRYDSVNKVGIKLRFSDTKCQNTKDELIEMLSKQYIDKIIESKDVNGFAFF